VAEGEDADAPVPPLPAGQVGEEAAPAVARGGGRPARLEDPLRRYNTCWCVPSFFSCGDDVMMSSTTASISFVAVWPMVSDVSGALRFLASTARQSTDSFLPEISTLAALEQAFKIAFHAFAPSVLPPSTNRSRTTSAVGNGDLSLPLKNAMAPFSENCELEMRTEDHSCASLRSERQPRHTSETTRHRSSKPRLEKMARAFPHPALKTGRWTPATYRPGRRRAARASAGATSCGGFGSALALTLSI